MTPEQLDTYTPEGFAGTLSRERQGYVFAYDPKASAEVAISLTMPVRAKSYDRQTLHPIFQMNLPEGYLLERLRQRLAKTVGMDPMLLLSLLGGDASIGRVRLQVRDAHAQTRGADDSGESLAAILAYRGAGGLFDSLVDKYLMRSALSGIQPKVLVPEAGEAGRTRSALTPEFIIKSGLDEFPGLAMNEYICMSIVKACGVPTPEFHLSDDRKLFVMRRFDRSASGSALGFEDLAVLSGKGAQDKYVGTYEALAYSASQFISDPQRKKQALAQIFDMVALSCLLGNGDGHLKNFGVLYASDDDVQLAPAYDIVNTTCYIPEDSLALSVGGSKSMLAARILLMDFAGKCAMSVSEARKRVRHLVEVAHAIVADQADLVDAVPRLRDALSGGLEQFRATFGS
jgi:serine/threonine-protein kinase HipA